MIQPSYLNLPPLQSTHRFPSTYLRRPFPGQRIGASSENLPHRVPLPPAIGRVHSAEETRSMASIFILAEYQGHRKWVAVGLDGVGGIWATAIGPRCISNLNGKPRSRTTKPPDLPASRYYFSGSQPWRNSANREVYSENNHETLRQRDKRYWP